MQLVGRRTYAVCITIMALALCQKFLGISVPNEVFIALFGLAVCFLRAGGDAGGNAGHASPSILAVVCLLTSAVLISLSAGCGTVSDQQTAEAKEVAMAYYQQPKVAELWSIKSASGNGRVIFEGFSEFTLNTPVPPISIMPKDPGSLAIIGDVLKTAVPYAAGAYLLHGEIGGSSKTVNNNAATP